jgi:hypothetical protein
MHVIPSRPIRVSLHPPPDPVESSLDRLHGGQPTTRCVVEVASAQGGCITRRQVLRLGFTSDGLEGWLEKGWLIPLHRGVYAVGQRPRTHEGLAWAAVLACGKGSKTSHGTSATCHALLRPYHRVHVTTPHKRSRPGITNHEADTETVWTDGLPCTTVARTLVDLAGCVPFGVLESAVRQAQVRGVLDVEAIGVVLLACPRARGIRRLRSILADPVALAPTRSRPERVALRALLAAGWDWPVVGKRVPGTEEEVDFHWPALRLVLEIDGPTHLTPVQDARDARRDATLRRLGWRVVRVPADAAAAAPALLSRALAA